VLADPQAGGQGDIVMVCPLCISPDCIVHAQIGSRLFFRCNSCDLVFVPKEYHLTQAQEKARYMHHENTNDNPEYVNYLSSIFDNVLRFVPQPVSILDFGSGAEHVLTNIIRARGETCVAHDPLYGMTVEENDRFDIVVACEALEHLRDPRRDMDLIAHHVKPEGFVYVRTRLHDGVRDFSSWYYAKDPTHISFYCSKTMETIAKILVKKIISTNNKDTVVFGPYK
jgi:SAM-dependent methyltransferase